MLLRRIFLVFLIAFCTLFPASSFAFSITPGIIDFGSPKGETGTAEFLLINTSSQEKTFYFDTQNFSASESGSPVFDASSKKDLATWMTLPSSLDVDANSQSQISFSVSVPDDIPSGSYQAAITISEYPSQVVAANGATIEATIALLVFVTVEGENIARFGLLDANADFTDRLVSLPKGEFTYRVQNQGNILLIPSGVFVIRDAFGRALYEQPLNISQGRVLPGTTRTFSEETLSPQSWKEFLGMQLRFWSFGPMTGEVWVTAEGQEEVALFSFWYVPWQLGAVVFGCLFLIWLVIRPLFQKKKS